MGRAVKLKRQRKRQQKQQQKQQQQQQRLNTLPFPSVFNLSEREIEQAFSALSDWVLERWSTVPQFVKYFTLSEAKKIAKETLSLFLASLPNNPVQDFCLELGVSDRFNILLFFHSQSLSIETKLFDNLTKTIFDLPGQFRLPSSPPSI